MAVEIYHSAEEQDVISRFIRYSLRRIPIPMNNERLTSALIKATGFVEESTREAKSGPLKTIWGIALNTRARLIEWPWY